MSSIAKHDQKMFYRCPKLGGEVPFRYCRTVKDGLFCERVIQCWINMMDIVAFLKENYSPEDISKCMQSSGGRIDIMTKTLQDFKKTKD